MATIVERTTGGVRDVEQNVPVFDSTKVLTAIKDLINEIRTNFNSHVTKDDLHYDATASPAMVTDEDNEVDSDEIT